MLDLQTVIFSLHLMEAPKVKVEHLVLHKMKIQLFFNTWQKKDFHEIKQMIDARREEIENRNHQSIVPHIQQGHTAVDLEKFAELRDKGIITNEEFEAKKKQILGL